MFIKNLFRNLQNELVSANRPGSGGILLVPHHTLVYATKTNLPQDPKELITQSTHPRPIFTINYLSKNINDPVTATLIKKKKHETEKRLIKVRLRKAKKLPEGLITAEMIKYMEMMESDPDPTLSGCDYDWRFTGGNLETIKVGESFKLVQPSMNDKYSLRLIDPAADSMEHIVMPFKSKYHESFYSYEMMKSLKFIGVRRKKSVNFGIIKTLEDNAQYLKAPLKFSWSSEIAASTLCDDKLLFIDVKNNLVKSSVRELITDSVIELPNDNPSLQFPISINSIDHNVISYTNRKSLSLVDFRDKKPSTIFDVKNMFMRCEEFSYHKNSLHDNLLFLASSHVLYGIDVRNTKEPMMHWNHQLIMQPTILKTVKVGDDEVICLSSNLPGDVKIFNCAKGTIENSWIVNRLPMKPRTIVNSYNQMRDRGKLLLSEFVQQRIKFSTTGIALIPDEVKSQVELYTQNSIGDVFKSNLLIKTTENIEDKSMKKNFRQWDEILELELDPLRSVSLHERLKSRELLVTDIVNLKGLSKVLRCKKFEREDDDDQDAQVMNTQKAPRWRTDLEDDKEYRDVLAQHMFVEWDLDINEFQPHPFAEALKESELKNDKGVDKVSRWLTTNSVDCEATVEVEDVAVPEMPLQEIYTQTTNIATQKTGVIKKAKRIKGF